MPVDQNGVLQVWNGIDPVLRFSATYGALETAGVVAPTATPAITGSGFGSIVGDYFAYVRFIDRDGNISSLSPVSAQFSAWSQSFNITGASNASPIVVTGTFTGIGTGQVIKVAGVTGNTAANGIWYAVPVTGGIQLWYDAANPSAGNGTYGSGGTLTTGLAQIQYLNVAVPTESKVVTRQILRNQDGDATVFYVDIETDDLTSDMFTSVLTSADLAFQTPVPLADENGHTLVDKTIPPNYKKFATFFSGRMFAAGNEPYTEGACVVTNGSRTVTGIGTEWGPLTFKGRFFEVVGGNKQYTIDFVTSTTSLTLTEPYEGSTDPYAYYTIHAGDGERRAIYWSEPEQPEAWPLSNSLTLEADPGAGELTALIPLRSWVYIAAENRLYRLSFVNDPLLDGFVSKSSKRGAVNNRCAVMAEDLCYMLDNLGLHAFAGNDDTDIGTPGVQDLFRQNPDSQYRINWNAQRYFHAAYDPGYATVRWFVSLGGNYTPHHAICYSLRLKRWWLEEYPFPIASSCVGRLNGKPQLFVGTNGKRIMAFGASPLDGPSVNTGTLRGTVTSAGLDWLACSSASYPTSGVVGNPIYIVRGKGKGQQRNISSVSSTRINVDQPWAVSLDTTSVFQIGGIAWHWRGGWLRWAEKQDNSTRAISIHSKPTAGESELYIRVYKDLADTAVDEWTRVRSLSEGNGIGLLANNPTTDLSIDTTKATGYVTQRMDGFRDLYTDAWRFMSLEVAGVSNEEPQKIFRVIVDGAQ